MQESELRALDLAIQESKGRCHSCMHCLEFKMPSETRYWCRSFNYEMKEERRQEVQGCPRWRPMNPHPEKRITGNLNINDPIVKELIEREDRLFWKIKEHLKSNQLDMKTMIIIANPSGQENNDLSWIEELEEKFAGEEPGQIDPVIEELRNFGYTSLALLIEQTIGKQIIGRKQTQNKAEAKQKLSKEAVKNFGRERALG